MIRLKRDIGEEMSEIKHLGKHRWLYSSEKHGMVLFKPVGKPIYGQARKTNKYRIHPQFATKNYGLDAPENWYEVTARTRREAEKAFAKRYKVPIGWVRKSTINKNWVF